MRSEMESALAGQQTLVASWRALARVSPGAHVHAGPGLACAVFPAWPPLNNAVVSEPSSAEAMATRTAEARAVYDAAGIDGWALWRPSAAADPDAEDEVDALPGMVRDTTTVVMTRPLTDDLPAQPGVQSTSIASATRASDEAVPSEELEPADGVAGLDGWVLLRSGLAVAGAWSQLEGDDCGIYAVGTVATHRRQGLGTTLMVHVMGEARRRGARTASLQSTRMGLPLYTALGFAAVGRYEEWVPA